VPTQYEILNYRKKIKGNLDYNSVLENIQKNKKDRNREAKQGVSLPGLSYN